MIACRSDFSREFYMFATKVAPTHTCKNLCELCGLCVSVAKKLSKESLYRCIQRIAHIRIIR